MLRVNPRMVLLDHKRHLVLCDISKLKFRSMRNGEFEEVGASLIVQDLPDTGNDTAQKKHNSHIPSEYNVSCISGCSFSSHSSHFFTVPPNSQY